MKLESNILKKHLQRKQYQHLVKQHQKGKITKIKDIFPYCGFTGCGNYNHKNNKGIDEE